MAPKINLLAISRYPSAARPAYQAFVRAIMEQFSQQQIDVSVIAPETVSTFLRWPSRSDRNQRTQNHTVNHTENHTVNPTVNHNGVTVHRPRYISFSARPAPLIGTTLRLTVHSYTRAVLREFARLNRRFDVCYAHFLFPHGHAALQVSKRYGVPALLALGESNFVDLYERTYSRKEIAGCLESFPLIVANSSLLKELCTERYGVSGDKIHVLPNGVDATRFRPTDRRAARQACGLPQEKQIVIAVGQFIDRKGPLRTLEAIRDLPNVGAVFLGTGPQKPTGDQVLFAGAVKHEDVPIWLSAADAFVMPTLDEGCSNAILEALACGLPIVSSDRRFNHEILNGEISVLVDPLRPEEIRRAIVEVLDNASRREAMRQAALAHSKSFNISTRTRRIEELILQNLRAEPAAA